jgi:glutaredoxin 3
MKKLLLTVALLAGLASIFLSAAPAEARCGSKGVVLYDAYWCPYCKQVKDLFARHGVRYRRIETTRNQQAQAEMMRRFGTVTVPVIVVDGTAVIGFDESRLRQLLCLR